MYDIQRTSIWKRQIFKKAGIKANGFHIIRHTVGTELGDKSHPRRVQEFLHHKDIRTTMKYVHNTDDEFAVENDILKDFLH